MNNLVNFKSFFKFLSKNKLYTAINIFGLSLSLMFVILIAVYTVQGLSTDKYHEKGDRIYAIGSEEEIGFAWRIGEKVAERYPEIEQMCPVVDYTYGRPAFIGEVKHQAGVLLTNEAFFDMFTFSLVQGEKQAVLAAKNYAVISESFARRAFPGADPMGQTITLNDSVHVMVNGIMKDIKNSTIPDADVVIKIDNVRFFNGSLDASGGDNATGCNVFFLVHEGADLLSKTGEIKEFLNEIFWFHKNGLREKVTLTPLKEIYFGDKHIASGFQQGDWKFVMILMSVGILILIFAVINYINLTVAQTGSRAKEMATRRLLGSSRGELFSRLIMESTLITLLSFLSGMFLAYLALPYANDLLQTKIDLAGAVTPVNVFIVIVLIAILGFISGLLPAFIISNSKPIDIVRGGFRRKTKMVFSKFFITFQNVITIMLLAASITMYTQVHHLIDAPLGYNTANIMHVNAYRFESREKIDAFVSEARQLASVSRIGYSQGSPFTRGNNNTVVYEDRNISFQFLVGDTIYFNMLGFEKIRENGVAGTQYFLNEQALLETGLPEDAVSLKLWKEMPIAGIVRDFQLRNITHNKQPVIVQIEKPEDFDPWNVMIEIVGDPFAAREQIKEVFERVSQLEFDGKFVDQQVEESFEPQRRTARIVSVFCLIAMLISMLGLLAMSTYFMQQRAREIAVRKVMGSTSLQMQVRLVGTFLTYVLIAFVLATPVIWYIMRMWLADYSYRISLAPWIFISAGLFCLLISFITVYWQSYNASNTNPIESVKAE